MSLGVALLLGALGAILACAALGPFGLFIGFGAGLSFGVNFLARDR